MDKKKVRWFLNRITNSRYVNLHFEGIKNSGDQVKETLGEITSGNYTNDYCIDVDIRDIPGAKKDNKEAGQELADIINRRMAESRFPYWIRDSLSIEHTLEQFDERLDRVVLIIFRCFKEPKNKEEKNILTSLRIFIGDKNPLYVQLLIISSAETKHWDLAPYSLLDERFVEYIPWSNLQ